MSYVDLIGTLAIVGVLLYLLNLAPIDATIKKIINVIVIVLVILHVCRVMGLFAHLSRLVN